jgi:DNA polymerase
MNPELHDTLAAYLQVRYRLGERHIELAGEAVRALRTYRRPGAPPAVQKTEAPAPKISTPRRVLESGTIPPVRSPVEPPPAIPAPPAVETVVVPTGPKTEQLQAIATALGASAACRALFRRSRNMVFGVGSPDAALMFIGEAPGEEEDLQGEPFVGPAGQLLTRMIETMGLKRGDVYIANICKYRPDMPVGASGNRKPTPQEMEACLPYLRAQIGVIQPRVIVALGATAVEGLFHLPRAPIMKMRGTWKELDGRPVMPTFHPAYLLRTQSLTDKRMVWEDLLQVMERLELPITDKQRRFFTPTR